MNLYLAVVFAVSSMAGASDVCRSEHKGLLYPHMAGNGDKELTPGDDVFEKLSTDCKYHLYGTGTHQLYIGSNGYVTFPNGETTFVPKNMCQAPPSSKKMYAALWEDNYPPAANAVGDHIWFRETTDKTLLARAHKDIKETFNDSACTGAGFEPKCLVIVTWQRQQSFCDNVGCCHCSWSGGGKRSADEEGEPVDETMLKNITREPVGRGHLDFPDNYYQMVLATDNGDTYAMFNYLCIKWWKCWDFSRAGFFDYNDGNSKCAELPNSGTNQVQQLDFNTNSNVDGRWIYRTDKALIKKPDCSNLQEGPLTGC